MADAYNPQIIFWICAPLAASIMIPTGLGYLADERVPEGKEGIDWALINQYPKIVAFCLIMAACAIGNAVIDILFFDEHMWQVFAQLETLNPQP